MPKRPKKTMGKKEFENLQGFAQGTGQPHKDAPTLVGQPSPPLYKEGDLVVLKEFKETGQPEEECLLGPYDPESETWIGTVLIKNAKHGDADGLREFSADQIKEKVVLLNKSNPPNEYIERDYTGPGGHLRYTYNNRLTGQTDTLVQQPFYKSGPLERWIQDRNSFLGHYPKDLMVTNDSLARRWKRINTVAGIMAINSFDF